MRVKKTPRSARDDVTGRRRARVIIRRVMNLRPLFAPCAALVLCSSRLLRAAVPGSPSARNLLSGVAELLLQLRRNRRGGVPAEHAAAAAAREGQGRTTIRNRATTQGMEARSRSPICGAGARTGTHSAADGHSAYVRRGLHVGLLVTDPVELFDHRRRHRRTTDYLLCDGKLLQREPGDSEVHAQSGAKWNDGTPIDWKTFEVTWKTQNGADSRYNPASTVGYSSIGSVTKGERDNEVIVTFKEPFYPYQHCSPPGAPEERRPRLLQDWLGQQRTSGAPDGTFHGRIAGGGSPHARAQPEVVGAAREARARRAPADGGCRDRQRVSKRRSRQHDDRRWAPLPTWSSRSKNMKDVQIRRGFGTFASIYVLGQRLLQGSRRARGFSTRRRPLADSRAALSRDGLEGRTAGLDLDVSVAERISRQHPGPALRPREGEGNARCRRLENGRRRLPSDGKLAEFNYVDFGDQPVFMAMDRAQQKMARDIGLKMNIDMRKSADFSKTLHDGSFDIVAMAFGGGSPFGYVYACQIYCTNFPKVTFRVWALRKSTRR